LVGIIVGTYQFAVGWIKDNYEIDALEVLSEVFAGVNWWYLIPMFLFYFVWGYIFYASLFAAIGSGADNESDTQSISGIGVIPIVIDFSL
jgi:ABC-2 type transport system permease protein